MKSPRPKLNDQAVLDAVAEKLFPRLVNWLNTNGDATNYADAENKQELMTQINGMLHRESVTDDGYRLARFMDQEGWDADSELVEILDHTSGYARNAHKALCDIWWADQGILGHQHGQKVKVLPACRNDARGHIGTIRDSHTDGKYTVNIPELGHVEPGKSGTSGIILEHELLEPVI